jgi:hypothetical protein
MKTKIYLLVILSSFNLVKGQNLIPNPGFETVSSCNISAGNISAAFPWSSPDSGSPDLYNACTTDTNFSVPKNQFGYQQAHSGNGYAGQVFYSAPSDYREFIQIKLDSALLPHQIYCASYYVSISHSRYSATNNFGVFFSPTQISTPNISSLNLTPQINDTSIKKDTLNWALIHGQYIAQGGEQYMIIGNFYNYTLTDTSCNINTYCSCSYYYIDDVDVHKGNCTISENTEELLMQEKFTIYPNPISNVINIESKNLHLLNYDITLYDILGNKLYSNKIEHTLKIDLQDYESGIYFLSISNGETRINRKIIKN